MVAVAVRVRDDQLVVGAWVVGQPALEQAVDGLADGEEVVVRVHLDQRLGRPSVDPVVWQSTGGEVDGHARLTSR